MIEIPTDLVLLQLPDSLKNRLQFLLDRQDAGVVLEEAERQEAVYASQRIRSNCVHKLRTTK